jgi:hypothetical protein
MTLTSDNASLSTPPTLPPTLHATCMSYCKQLPGGTIKTEQAMELVDDLASLLTRKRMKKKTPHSDDPYARLLVRFACIFDVSLRISVFACLGAL